MRETECVSERERERERDTHTHMHTHTHTHTQRQLSLSRWDCEAGDLNLREELRADRFVCESVCVMVVIGCPVLPKRFQNKQGVCNDFNLPEQSLLCPWSQRQALLP